MSLSTRNQSSTHPLIVFLGIWAANLVGCVHTSEELLSLIWRETTPVNQHEQKLPSAKPVNRNREMKSEATGKVKTNSVAGNQSRKTPEDVRYTTVLNADPAIATSRFTGSVQPGEPNQPSWTWVASSHTRTDISKWPPQRLVNRERADNRNPVPNARSFHRISDSFWQTSGRDQAVLTDNGQMAAHKPRNAVDHINSLMQQTKDDLRSGRLARLGAQHDSILRADQPKETIGPQVQCPERAQLIHDVLTADSSRIVRRISNQGIIPGAQSVATDVELLKNQTLSQSRSSDVTRIRIPRLITNSGATLKVAQPPAPAKPIEKIMNHQGPESLSAEPAASDLNNATASGSLLPQQPFQPVQLEKSERSAPRKPSSQASNVKLALSNIDWGREPDVTNDGFLLKMRVAAILAVLGVLFRLVAHNRRRSRFETSPQ